MSLTVRDALGLEPLTRAHVLAGRQGLDREIKTVTIMDTPDIKNWVKGGELVLTNVFVIKDDTRAQVELVRDLFEHGVAALGVKLKRFVDELPQEMLDLATDLGFPIIEMPVDVAWIEVLNPVLTEVLNRQASRLEQSQRIHDHFTRAALLGRGLPDILATLSRITGCPSAVTDLSGKVLSEASAPPAGTREEDRVTAGQADGHAPVGQAEAPLPALDWAAVAGDIQPEAAPGKPEAYATDWHGHSIVVAPLAAGSDTYGRFLLALGPDTNREMAFVALEHASTVATLEMIKSRAVLEAEKQFRNDFLQDLLAGNVESREAAYSRAKSLGNWDFTRPHTVLVVDLDQFEKYYLRHRELDEARIQRTKEEFQDIVALAARAANSAAVTVAWSDSVTILLPVDGQHERLRRREDAKSFAAALKAQVRSRLREVTVSIGIGRFHPDVLDWRLSYGEARLALEYGRRIWGHDVIVHYDDLGTYRLLLTHGNLEEIRNFADEYLAPLTSEAGSGQWLFETLETYFACNRQVRETAEALFVHVNTVRHRLARAHELLGFDPDSAEDCLNLEMALRCRTYLNSEKNRRARRSPEAVPRVAAGREPRAGAEARASGAEKSAT